MATTKTKSKAKDKADLLSPGENLRRMLTRQIAEEHAKPKPAPVKTPEIDKDVLAVQRKLERGDEITEKTLTNLYGPYAVRVFGSKFLGLLRSREGAKIKTSVKTRSGKMKATSRSGPTLYSLNKGKKLPSKDEFYAARDKMYETTLGGMISDAYSEFESLGQECREAYDNLEGANMGHMERTEAFGTAADTLEGLREPTVPDLAEKIKIVDLPDLSHRTGRAHRCSVATDKLQAVIDEINEAVPRLKGRIREIDQTKGEEQARLRKVLRDELGLAEGDEDITESDLDELENLASELESAMSDAEGVEFPGLYG